MEAEGPAGSLPPGSLPRRWKRPASAANGEEREEGYHPVGRTGATRGGATWQGPSGKRRCLVGGEVWQTAGSDGAVRKTAGAGEGTTPA